MASRPFGTTTTKQTADDQARCDGFGDPLALGMARPLLTLLMGMASFQAMQEYQSHERPFLLTRSGCPGIQRYAQTWSGDNSTSWETLQYNIPMGLGLSLSGMPNTGHDVGGFAGQSRRQNYLYAGCRTETFSPVSPFTRGTAMQPLMSRGCTPKFCP